MLTLEATGTKLVIAHVGSDCTASHGVAHEVAVGVTSNLMNLPESQAVIVYVVDVAHDIAVYDPFDVVALNHLYRGVHAVSHSVSD